MRGLAGMFGTARWKRAATARRGNWTQAIFAGLSTGPSVRENLKATGVRRSNGAGSVRCSRPTPARLHQEENPGKEASVGATYSGGTRRGNQCLRKRAHHVCCRGDPRRGGIRRGKATFRILLAHSAIQILHQIHHFLSIDFLPGHF